MNKIIIEGNIFEGLSGLTGKFIGALIGGKIKKISAPNTTNGKSFANAVNDLKRAAQEMEQLVSTNPELEAILDDII